MAKDKYTVTVGPRAYSFMTNQLVLPFVEEKTRNSLVVNSVHQRFRRQLPLAI